MAADSATELYGTDMAFKSDFVVTATGDLDTLSGLDNLKDAIIRRIFTVKGAIIHRPNYGVGLQRYLNGINSLAVQQKLAIEIQEQLLLDPRIEKFDGLRVEQSANNPSMIKITLRVTPVGYSELSLTFSSEGI